MKKTENLTAPAENAEGAKERNAQKRIILSFVFKLISVVVVFFLIFTFVFGVSVADGEQMYPRIRDGDLLLWYRIPRNYAVGDVVTFKIEGKRCTGRIVAVGGETVNITDESRLEINGNVRDEEIFYPTSKMGSEMPFPLTVSENNFFILCDFRTNAEDSRIYGQISKDEIDGKIMSLLRRRGI